MVVTSLFISLKLASVLVKEMVNLESARRFAPNLLSASRQWIREYSQRQLQQLTANQNMSPDEKLNSTEYLVHNWLEALFAWFQVIVLWHDPFVSLCALSGLLSSFLLLTYFAPRFYATVMIAIFIYNLTKVWFRHVWPEIRVPPESEEAQRLDVDRWTYLHPQLMTLVELGQFINNLMKLSEHHVNKLLILRQETPVKFCLVVCSILSCTAYVGNRVSGCKLLFSSAILLVTAPGIYLHLLPKYLRDYLKQNVGLKIVDFIQSGQQLESSELTQQSSSPPPPLSTLPQPQTINQSESSTLAPLLEYLKRKSSIIKYSSQEPIQEVIGENDTSSANDHNIVTHKVSFSQDAQEQSSRAEERKSSEDISSNDSVSLIDSEDDQQDGFVLL